MEELAARFTPAFVAWMRVQSTTQTAKKCLRRGVGAMIRELRDMTPANGTGQYIDGAKADLRLLESFCRSCGKCAGP